VSPFQHEWHLPPPTLFMTVGMEVWFFSPVSPAGANPTTFDDPFFPHPLLPLYASPVFVLCFFVSHLPPLSTHVAPFSTARLASPPLRNGNILPIRSQKDRPFFFFFPTPPELIWRSVTFQTVCSSSLVYGGSRSGTLPVLVFFPPPPHL